MKRLLLCGILGLASTPPSFSADTNLGDEVLNVVVAHIQRVGPDYDSAQFISMYGEAWARRKEIVNLVAPFLTDKSPDKVAGAILVLYRFRGHIQSGIGDFRSQNAAYFADLDKQVYQHLDHFRELKSDSVYKSLALYLGISRELSADRELQDKAKNELLNIVRSPAAGGSKEQALICLAWGHDPADMDLLLPYMLEDSQAARSLPYHFRNSYGVKSTPYLIKALSEAKSASARLEAAFELVHLHVSEGFQYLRKVALQDPERIRSFAIDYLGLPQGALTAEVAAYIEKKQAELCKPPQQGAFQNNEIGSWSASTNGLQARVTLVERSKINSTRWIVPYLELRNVRDLAHPMEVRCDRKHVRFELVDASGRPVRDGQVMDRSGPVPDLGSIILPLDSSIRMSMECRNWGVPKAAAMISTDSGAWVIKDAERGQVFLRATITGQRVEGDRYKVWHGKIETPWLRVDWR